MNANYEQNIKNLMNDLNKQHATEQAIKTLPLGHKLLLILLTVVVAAATVAWKIVAFVFRLVLDIVALPFNLIQLAYNKLAVK